MNLITTLGIGGLSALALITNNATDECCSRSAKPALVANAVAGEDIVGVAQAAGSFNTLLKAAAAAGLVDALRGDGPLTVFAPTDEAFAKLDQRVLGDLLKPENKA
ncbi:MAG: fasciclin domain-containing protein, partial [Planctomycetota bacterium]